MIESFSVRMAFCESSVSFALAENKIPKQDFIDHISTFTFLSSVYLSSQSAAGNQDSTL